MTKKEQELFDKFVQKTLQHSTLIYSEKLPKKSRYTVHKGGLTGVVPTWALLAELHRFIKKVKKDRK